MKVILSGGGTGGHIYPALTIADKIKSLRPDAEIVFVGTLHGLEKELVPRQGYPIEFIDVAGFKRSFSLDTVKSTYKLFTGLADAQKLLNEIKPDLVIGTGGYVCGPIVFLAALKGIPTCIQEQNALPGVTNKILARFAKKVFLGAKEAANHFPSSADVEFTGNPIRTDILDVDRKEALKELGLEEDKTTILVTGGSLGAQSINNAMLEVEKELSGRCDVQILHATGNKNYDAYMEQVKKIGGFASNITITPYLHDMPQALAVADLGVFRAGALGLAELTAKGIPAILIPYPYATGNHQEFNAKALETVGAAKVILDKDLTGRKLLENIEELLLDKSKLVEMGEVAKSLGRPYAAAQIAKKALELVKN